MVLTGTVTVVVIVRVGPATVEVAVSVAVIVPVSCSTPMHDQALEYALAPDRPLRIAVTQHQCYWVLDVELGLLA